MSGNKLKEAVQNFRDFRQVTELSSDDTIRIREQPRLVSSYYDAVTSFYEFGWGPTFHFAPRRPGESLPKSLRRHNEGIGKLLRLGPKMEVADIGCGVGGPLINIAKATGARIVGININMQQLRRGRDLVRKAGLLESCSFLYADFMDVPYNEATFDAMYSIEAICHAPDRDMAFRELFRLLKPGAEAAIIDWTLTDDFDRSNSKHNEIKAQIEHNNATPNLSTTGKYIETVQAAGFEVIEAKDQQAVEGDPSTPWYMALQGRDISLSSFARTPMGRAVIAKTTGMLERIKVVPAGVSEASRLLNAAADALVEAGKLGIFTPSFLVHARKPQ
ncbi:MAG: methyltransferase domain-containing protein [Gammaproteobacteria bacterium]|nr:methyltransferase domain-containing protein [Gammaproteobacteria bacterium]